MDKIIPYDNNLYKSHGAIISPDGNITYIETSHELFAKKFCHGEDYTKLDYNMPVCLIIGNEGHGMSKVLKDNVDFMAKIPMVGKINSLNASVAAGITIYEVFRQKNER